jgi:hypothetical protein
MLLIYKERTETGLSVLYLTGLSQRITLEPLVSNDAELTIIS